MSIDAALLEIVCCPVTRSPLQILGDDRLQRLNEEIERQRIKSQDGAIVAAPLEQVLVTRDGRLAYPVRDGIPVLLEDQGILMSQIDAA